MQPDPQVKVDPDPIKVDPDPTEQFDSADTVDEEKEAQSAAKDLIPGPIPPIVAAADGSRGE